MAIEINGDTGISGVNGSATTPAIQGTDTNTGLSFGTDEVNIVTGGSTAVTVDSSQRVGIGTTAPDTALTVSESNVAVTSQSSNVNIYANDALAADIGGSVGLGATWNGTGGLINYASIHGKKANATSGNTDGYLSFVVRNNAGTSERLRINKDGALGIGGTAFGTSGQVLTSQGSGSAPQWATPATGANLVVGTQQSATGTSIELTSIPTNCQKIEIICYQVSWNTTASLRWQLGDFGGYENTGYFNQTMYWVNGTSNQSGTSTGSFGLSTWTGSGHGVNTVIRLYRRHTTGQNWNSECIADTTLSGTEMMIQAGTKDLSAGLDRVQLFPSAGSFDNGFIQFNYWTV